MPPRKKRTASDYDEDDESSKRAKTTKTTPKAAAKGPKAAAKEPKKKPEQKETGKKFTDEEGNSFWELGGRLRRVTLSKFKGKMLVDIREHYEKDGKVMPGKKGISLSPEQFEAFLSVLPQIEDAFAEESIKIPRPVYDTESPGSNANADTDEKKTGEGEEEAREEDEG